MRRVQPTSSKVNASERDAEGVEPDEVIHVDGGYHGLQTIVRVSRLVQAREEEVFGLDLSGVLADDSVDEHCIIHVQSEQRYMRANYFSAIRETE